jgi:hypothetical protein
MEVWKKLGSEKMKLEESELAIKSRFSRPFSQDSCLNFTSTPQPELLTNLPSAEHLPLTLKLSLVKERVSPRAKQLLDHN